MDFLAGRRVVNLPGACSIRGIVGAADAAHHGIKNIPDVSGRGHIRGRLWSAA